MSKHYIIPESIRLTTYVENGLQYLQVKAKAKVDGRNCNVDLPKIDLSSMILEINQEGLTKRCNVSFPLLMVNDYLLCSVCLK